MKKTTVTCDVIGCGEEANNEVDCCHGYMVNDGGCRNFKKFERPLKAEKTDLCYNHLKEWAKLTCKLLKMDKESK